MSQPDQIPARVFEHSVDIPADAALRVWQTWCALSGWPDWDASLSGVKATDDGLSLGKRFAVVPKAAPAPIPVNVTAFEQERHFTTSSVSPLGLLSFGHSVSPGPSPDLARVTHSICAVSGNDTPLPEPIWARLKSDVVESVSTLAQVASEERDEVTA